jgi:hypothetical protein
MPEVLNNIDESTLINELSKVLLAIPLNEVIHVPSKAFKSRRLMWPPKSGHVIL